MNQSLKHIIIFLLVSICLSGRTQDILDPFNYSSRYKNISSIDSLNLIYSDCQQQVSGLEEKWLNTIAYCDAIDLKGAHDQALELMQELNSSTNIEDIPDYIVSEYHSVIGNISLRNENPELAVAQFNKSLNLISGDFIPEHSQTLYMRMSNGLNATGKHDQAMIQLENALALETHGTNRNSLYLRLNIALTNSLIGNLEDAKLYFNKALVLLDMNNDNYAKVRTLGNLADIYALQDSFELSEKYYIQGMNLASSTGMTLDLIRFHKSLSELYAQFGKFDQSYIHANKSDSISQKFNSSKVSEEIISMELNHQIEKEKLNNTIKSQNLLAERNKRTFLIWTTLLLSLALIIFLFFMLKLKQKNRVLLEQTLRSSSKKDTIKQNTNSNQYTELIIELEAFLQDNEILFDSDLSVEFLAKKLHTNRTYLSEAINSHYHKSFSRLINELRIDHAKQMLLDPSKDHFSIEGIASTVGFASISSFNSNFKRIVGFTPSYLRKNRDK